MLKGKLVGNSFWAIVSSLFQNIIYSLFFIVIARTYSTTDFSSYIIANTLYGLLLSFSSLGLSQWFIREIKESSSPSSLIDRFFKIQLTAGLFFYILNIAICFLLYESPLVRNISLLLGVNILFDNLIYVFKTINISRYHQRRTFFLTSFEATIKLVFAFVVMYVNIDIFFVVLSLIFLRSVTLFLFFRFGLSEPFHFTTIFKGQLNLRGIGTIFIQNIYFVVIGSVSVIYWSTGSLLVSKFLEFDRIADYEISFKLFSMAEIIPVMVSASVFPIFVENANADQAQRNGFFRKIFIGYAVYGLLAFTFIYSYADLLIPVLFGDKYIETSSFCIQMFLTIIIFPTALLQANMIVSMRMEKIDMWLNLLSLVLNISISLIGLYFIKDLSVINYAIFISFLCFHLFQDIVLLRAGVSRLSDSILFYGSVLIVLLVYYSLSILIPSHYLFLLFWLFIVLFLAFFKKYYLQKSVLPV